MSEDRDHAGSADSSGVGSVAEEAAKLLGALQGWAKDNAGQYAGAASAAADAAAATLHDIDEHIATGGEDCRYCPICRVISAVRATDPEVKQHLTSAATSLFHALNSAMATQPPSRSGRDEPVEKIDLDGDWPEG